MRLLLRLSALERQTARRKCEGVTYIGLLVLIVIIGIVLAQVGEVGAIARKREKEAQLLWVGDQYRRALASYRAAGGFPQRLEDLLQDPRTPNVRRYLRQLYPDPITGSTDWGLLKVGELITGVYSKSEDEPLKKANFPMEDSLFEGKEKYSELVFTNPLTARMLLTPRAPSPGLGQQPGQQQPGQQQPRIPGQMPINTFPRMSR